jgi:hypothetical protein
MKFEAGANGGIAFGTDDENLFAPSFETYNLTVKNPGAFISGRP